MHIIGYPAAGCGKVKIPTTLKQVNGIFLYQKEIIT